MKQLQWMKINVGLYSDPRMVRMLRQPHGELYHLVLFVLRDFAGAINRNGQVYITTQEPLTAKDLAHYLHRRVATMDKALDVLEELEFISRDENGIIQIVDWDDLQGCDKDQLRREQTRQRVSRYRQRQKEEQQEENVSPAAGQQEETVLEEVPANVPEEVLPADDDGNRDVPADDTATAVTVREALPAEICGMPGSNSPSWRDHECIRTYEAYFGTIGASCAQRLLALEQDWGEPALLQAMGIAADKGISNVKYIQAILVNSNGRVERKEKSIFGNETIDEHVDRMLREANELV